MPRKIRELEANLARAGFRKRTGKGSHRVWEHAKVPGGVAISGQQGDDAKSYQEREVKAAILKSKS